MLTRGTLGSTTANGIGTFTATLTANQIGANSAIRFRTTGDGNNWDFGDNFYVDNFTINYSVPGLNSGVDASTARRGTTRSSGTPIPRLRRTVVIWSTEEPKARLATRSWLTATPSTETYRIYTRAARERCRQHRTQRPHTEIVITRNGTDDCLRHRGTHRDRGDPDQWLRSCRGIRNCRERHLPDLRRLLGDQPAPQHHHHRWRRGRRHGRHLAAHLGAPDRVPLQRRQRHHRRNPSRAGRDRARTRPHRGRVRVGGERGRHHQRLPATPTRSPSGAREDAGRASAKSRCRPIRRPRRSPTPTDPRTRRNPSRPSRDPGPA